MLSTEVSVSDQVTRIKQQVSSLRLHTSTAEFIDWRRQYMEDGLVNQDLRRSVLLTTPSQSIGAYLIHGKDGRSWYVGETSEHFRIRMNRHNTRSDVLANRLLHPAEWGRIDLFQVDEKHQTKQIEAQIYYSLVDSGLRLLNPKIPSRPQHEVSMPVPTLSVEFGQQQPDYMRRAFALHTLELGEWILTARNLPGYRAAFGVRWDYLQSLKSDQTEA